MLLSLLLVETHEEEIFLEKIYRKYKCDMFTVANSVLHNQYDSEDAVHNAFVSVIDKLPTIQRLEPRILKGYLCKAAYNCAINISLKQQRERQVISFTDDELCSYETESDILEDIYDKESVKVIKNNIAALPDTYRDVVYLYLVENMNTNQIATALRIKSATVRQKLLRGRKILRENIRRQEGYYEEKE